MDYSRPSSFTPISSPQPRPSQGQQTTSERLVQGGQNPHISQNQPNTTAYSQDAYHTAAFGAPSTVANSGGAVPSQRSLNFHQPVSYVGNNSNPIHNPSVGDKPIVDHHYAAADDYRRASMSAGQGNNSPPPPPRSLSSRHEENFYLSSARDAQQVYPNQAINGYNGQHEYASGYGMGNPPEYQNRGVEQEQQGGRHSPSNSALFIKRADSVYSAVHMQSTSDTTPMTNLNNINNKSNMHSTSGDVSNPASRGITLVNNTYNNEKGSFDRHDGLTISRHPSGLNAAVAANNTATVNNVPSVRYFASSAASDSMDGGAHIQMRRDEETKKAFLENGGEEFARRGSVPHHYQPQHLGAAGGAVREEVRGVFPEQNGGNNTNAYGSSVAQRSDERIPLLAGNAPLSSYSRKPSLQPSSGAVMASADHQLQPQPSRSRSVAGAARPMTPISAAPSHVQLQQRYGAYSATPSGVRTSPAAVAAVDNEELAGRTQTLTSSEKIRRLQLSRAQSGGVGQTASNAAQTNGTSNRAVNFSSSHLHSHEGQQHSSLSPPSPAAAAANRVPSVVGGRGVSDELSLSPSRPRGGAEAGGSISLPLTRSSVSTTTIATHTPSTTTPTSGSSSAGKIGDSKAVKTRLVATHQVKAIDFLRRALLPLHHRGDLTRDDMVVVCSAVCTAYLGECGHSQEFLDETNPKPLSRDDEQLLTTFLLRTLKDLSAIKAGTMVSMEGEVQGRGRSFVSSPSPAATPTTSMRQGSVGLQQSALYSDAPSSLSNAEAKQEASVEQVSQRNEAQRSPEPSSGGEQKNAADTFFKQDRVLQDAAAQTSHLVSRAQSALEKRKTEEDRPRELYFDPHANLQRQDAQHNSEDHTIIGMNTSGKVVADKPPRTFSSPPLFQSVSYTISGSFPRSVNNIAYRPRYDSRDDSFGLGRGRMVNINDAILKAALTCPTVHDPEIDSVIIGTVSTYTTVALTWWLAYGPERKVLNLDKMYTNGLVATYQISDTSFILSIKAGALVAGWDYAVYLSVANSEGTAVSAASSFVVPAVSADDLALEYSNERGAGSLSLMQASSAKGGRRGSANGNPFTGRTRDGYFGDLDVREDEVPPGPYRNGNYGKERGSMHSDLPFDSRDSRKRAYAHGVVRGKPLSDLGEASAYYDQRDLELIRQRNEAFANLETERSRGSRGAVMVAAEGGVASRTQSTRSKLRTMSAVADNHATASAESAATRGHIDPNYIPPVAAMPATYQEQLRYFFIEQIEPLYYLSPNPAMPEEVFKSIVKDTARRYWFACDKSQQLTDALRREIIDTIKARIAESVLMPPQQRQQIYDLETARAEAEARRQRAEEEEAEASYVASNHQHQQRTEAHRGGHYASQRGVSSPQSSPYYRTYEPQSDSAYYGLTGAY